MRKMKMIGHAIAMAALGVSTGAMAYESGDWIVRAGYASVHPDDSSNGLKLNGAPVAGTGVGVDTGAALGITASYMLAPHWGVELLAATPFTHDITVKGLGAYIPDGTKIGSTKQLPPTLSLQYYFADSTSQWQPYLGVGVNYTTFFDESVTSSAKSALGAHNLSLDDSVGLAGEIGLDWAVSQNWLINASVWKADIKTDASLDTALGRVTTKVTIDPVVYMVAVGYKF